MKLLFTDLDGTLLNNDSQVAPDTKAFLDEFLLAGNKLILSSGRPKDSILEVKNNAGLTQPGVILICSNGTQVYDCDSMQTIMEKRLPLPYVTYLQAQQQNTTYIYTPIGTTLSSLPMTMKKLSSTAEGFICLSSSPRTLPMR